METQTQIEEKYYLLGRLTQQKINDERTYDAVKSTIIAYSFGILLALIIIKLNII